MINWKNLFGALFGLGICVTVLGQEPDEKPDGSYITLKGRAVAATPGSFLLDYGEGKINVEMENWDWYGKAYTALEDKNVTVYGYVDDAFFEAATVRASGIYVEDLNTYFFVRGLDEESAPVAVATIFDYDLKLNGVVTSISGREFALDTGANHITVDTSKLGYDPLDKNGSRRIGLEDRVSVFGNLDAEFFGDLEISAKAIVKLHRDEPGAY